MMRLILFVAFLILGGIMFKDLPKIGYVKYDSHDTTELQIIVEELKFGAGENK